MLFRDIQLESRPQDDPAIGACIECSPLGRHHLIHLGEPIRLSCGSLDRGSAVRVAIKPEEPAEDLDSASGIAWC